MSSICNSKPIDNLAHMLKVDAGHRYEGVECDLFGANDIHRAVWDYPVPTLERCNSSRAALPQGSISDGTFAGRLAARFPFLLGFDWTGVLLAGGAVQQTISDLSYDICDVDLFLYGMSEQGAAAKVRRIAAHVTMGRPAKYARSEHAITITMPAIKPGFEDDIVQIILRIYQTPSETLHGFDLGSAAVGWNGQRLMFTSLSRFAYSYGLNVFDNTRRSTTYERRIAKYMDRGFGLIVEKWRPCLDVSNNDANQLHYRASSINKNLNIVIVNVDHGGNRISCYLHARGPRSDYGHTYTYRPNISGIIRGDKGYIYVSKHIDGVIDGGYGTSVAGKIDRLYSDILETFSRPELTNNDYAKLKYMLHTSHIDIINKRDDLDWLIKVVEKERECALIAVASSEIRPMKFMTKNPGTQVTSSFNPVLEDERTWYGKYYRG